MGMNLKSNFSLRGEFHFIVTDHNGDVVTHTESPNLILDQGKDYIGLAGTPGQPELFGYAHIGTGTTTASASQTQLDAFSAAAARTSANWSNSGSPSYNKVCTFVYSFAQGAVIGNMSEVGISRTAATGQLFSRARIVDSGGNPTTLALTAFQQLTIVYVLTLVPDLSNVPGQVVLGGTTYNYTACTTYANGLTGYTSMGSSRPPFSIFLGSTGSTQGECYAAGTPLSSTVLTDTNVPGSTGSTSVQDTGLSSYSYTLGTYVGNTSFVISKPNGNVSGGIQCIRLFTNFAGIPLYIIYYFTVPIPKNSDNTLTLGLQVSWN